MTRRVGTNCDRMAAVTWSSNHTLKFSYARIIACLVQPNHVDPCDYYLKTNSHPDFVKDRISRLFKGYIVDAHFRYAHSIIRGQSRSDTI